MGDYSDGKPYRHPGIPTAHNLIDMADEERKRRKEEGMTPRTDAVRSITDGGLASLCHEYESLARTLERELAAVRTYLERSQAAEAQVASMLLRTEKAERELAEARKDAAKYQECLDAMKGKP